MFSSLYESTWADPSTHENVLVHLAQLPPPTPSNSGSTMISLSTYSTFPCPGFDRNIEVLPLFVQSPSTSTDHGQIAEVLYLVQHNPHSSFCSGKLLSIWTNRPPSIIEYYHDDTKLAKFGNMATRMSRDPIEAVAWNRWRDVSNLLRFNIVREDHKTKPSTVEVDFDAIHARLKYFAAFFACPVGGVIMFYRGGVQTPGEPAHLIMIRFD